MACGGNGSSDRKVCGVSGGGGNRGRVTRQIADAAAGNN